MSVTLRQPTYGPKKYTAGLNCKGLPSQDNEPLKPTSARGKRRKQKAAHVHTWVARRFVKSTSYHEARVQNEMIFDCSRVKQSKRPGGGPHTSGCGMTCRSPKI